MDTTPRSPRPVLVRFAAAWCLGALVLAGCGASGGETAATSAGPSTTEAAATSDPGGNPGVTETTDDGGEPATTETTGAGNDEPGGEVSLDDLESILPEAAVAGDGFHSESDVEEGYDEPDDFDLALDEQCPQALDLLDDVVDEGRVGRAFQGDGDRVLRVVLDPTPDSAWSEDRLDITVAAAQGCGAFELEQDGLSITADLVIERNDSYGDRGVAAHATITIESPELPKPVAITVGLRAWVVDSVLVVTSSTDGVDEETYDTIPADHERVETVSADLEEQLADLLG